MSVEDQKKNVIQYYWNQAVESLESAEREFNARSFNFAVNRTYYAAFYAVTAALLDRNLKFVKHSGVKAAFHKELIKTGLLERKWSIVYDRLFEDRQQSDYVALVSFEPDFIKEQITLCCELLDVIRLLIASLNDEKK